MLSCYFPLYLFRIIDTELSDIDKLGQLWPKHIIYSFFLTERINRLKTFCNQKLNATYPHQTLYSFLFAPILCNTFSSNVKWCYFVASRDCFGLVLTCKTVQQNNTCYMDPKFGLFRKKNTQQTFKKTELLVTHGGGPTLSLLGF